MLSNHTYIGKVRYGVTTDNMQIFEGNHTPIVDESKFYEVKKLIQKRKNINEIRAGYLLELIKEHRNNC